MSTLERFRARLEDEGVPYRERHENGRIILTVEADSGSFEAYYDSEGQILLAAGIDG